LIQGLDTDILTQFKRGKPIYERTPVPTFRTDYERDKYYDNKKAIWREGANGLPGMLIYYLDEIYLANRVTGVKSSPICRDIDVLIFHKIEQLRKEFKWLYITKGRGLGLSTIMFSIPHWFFRMYPGSKCVATTGKDKKTLGHLFSNYFMHSYNNLDELIKPKFINKNETSAESYLKIQVKTKDELGRQDFSLSEFICRETSDNPKSPTAFSGYGAIYGGVDEIPLHPRREDLLKSLKEIFVDPFTKEIVGFCLGGGTIEDVLTAEDIVKLKRFIDNCEALNFHHAFIPATWGNCMTNGWSDLKMAEEKILRKREELDKLEDKSFLKAEIKNNPLNLDEIFEMGGSGKFEDDVILKVRETIKVASKITQPRYDLVDMNGNIITSPTNSTKSPFVIFEQPKEGVSYKAGNDGTGSTKESGVIEGSDVAMVVTKMYDPSDPDSSYTPVAWYAERPLKFDDSYAKQANLMKLFNKFGLLKVRLQTNQANEHFGAYLTKEGLGKLLGLRHDLGGVAKENKNKMGTFITPDIIEWQYRQANRILRKYGHNFKMLRLLEEILLPYETNTDILDAWLMCLIEMGIDFDKPKTIKPPQKPKPELSFDQNLGMWVIKKPDEVDEFTANLFKSKLIS
jgi:hypothetical protein